MDAPVGPSPIATNGQITLPKAILEGLGWTKGTLLYFVVDSDDPESVQLVPQVVIQRRYERGMRAEKLDRLVGGGVDASVGEESANRPGTDDN